MKKKTILIWVLFFFVKCNFNCFGQTLFNRVYKMFGTGSSSPWQYDTLPQVFQVDTNYYLIGRNSNVYIDQINDSGEILSRHSLSVGYLDYHTWGTQRNLMSSNKQLVSIGRTTFDSVFINSYNFTYNIFNWSKVFTGIDPYNYSINEITDNKVAVSSDGFNIFRPRFFIFDSLGSCLKAFQFDNGARGSAVFTYQISPSDFLIGINAWYDAMGFYLLRMDTSGTIIWQQKFCSGMDGIRDAVLNADKSVTVIAEVNPNCSPDSNCYSSQVLFKIDSLGNQVWTKWFKNDYEDINPRSIFLCKDSGYIIASDNIHFLNGWGYTISMSLTKTDENGNIEWMHRYRAAPVSNPEGAYDVIQTKEGGYAMTGYCYRYIPPIFCFGGCWDIYFMTTDSMGNSNSCYDSVITSFYTTCDAELIPSPGNFTVITPGYYLSAVSIGDSITDIPPQFYGCTVAGTKEISDEKPLLKLSPNPATNEVIVSFKNPMDLKGKVIIYNSIGMEQTNFIYTGNECKINVETLPSGLYFVILYFADFKVATKLVIE